MQRLGEFIPLPLALINRAVKRANSAEKGIYGTNDDSLENRHSILNKNQHIIEDGVRDTSFYYFLRC